MMNSALLLAVFLPATLVSAGERVDYDRDIKPILRARCTSCHGALKQKSGLRLDTASFARGGGDSGPAIEPGDASGSLLFERVTTTDEADRMPPEGKPLSPRQIELLRAWIDQGAGAPIEERPEEDVEGHWAFRRLERPVLPEVPSRPEGSALSDVTLAAWKDHPIDRLVAALYAKRGLKPVALAEKPTLLRRVYLDLIGLPPTRTELQAFEKDPRPDAWERVVDRLLSSPEHGERWARHWMDVWRYTDWYGLGNQLRYSQKHIWHWRDWIIQSVNEDKGYDRMIREMLAADELMPTDDDALRATGFLARNYFLFNRTTWLDATIEHTSKAFLGLTMNCAKCHDHKYDPIRQVDYYRLRAFFEPHQVRLDTVRGETDLEKNGLPRVFDAHPEAPTYLHIRGNAKEPDTSHRLQPRVPEALAFGETTGGDMQITPVSLPVEAYLPALREFVLEDHLDAARKEIEEARARRARAAEEWAALEEANGAHRGGTEEGRNQAAPAQDGAGVRPGGDARVSAARHALRLADRALAAAELRPAALRTAHAADMAKHQSPPPDELKESIARAARAAREYELAVAELRVVEAEKKVRASEGEKKKQAERERDDAVTKVAEARKALTQPGDRYPSLRASLKALEGPDETDASRRRPYPKTSTGRRSALARWITDRRNPLTARVAVNHVWLRHFGQPLVESVTDFGRRAPRPPHHDLLDWLAVEFMESGWSMKHLHRLIVTSRAYRLSSSTLGADAATREADPENTFHWRRRPVRMESQVIRDALLHLAGQLDRRIGGPPVDPKQAGKVFRRSFYFTHSRDDRDRLLSMFDDADILACYRRSESIVPQQALALSNSRLPRLVAHRLTTRLNNELGEVEDDIFLGAAYETILAEKPTDEEIATCREALVEMKKSLVEGARGHDASPQIALRARENLVHALLNHNDFITIR